ncbi:MAG TPA: agmatine deiminase [Acidimicrobiales bacterium]|nr:agmatine deiminase [Acidimicrobiales bacterium]
MTPAGPVRSTPAADGFAMPAEWEPHDGCYMVWPERTDTWRLGAKPAQAAFAAVAAAIGATEPVTMLASARQWRQARAVLPPTVRVVEATTDDAWARDTGPTFVVDAGRTERRGVDWVFNGWGGLDGGLLFPWDHDDQVAAKVCDLERAPRYRAPLVLEGGSVHVDGDGTCLTTAECLLNRNRNPELSRADVEGHLRAYLGVDAVVWLPRGVPFDETDGHVDNLACFCAPGRVLLTWTDDRADPLYEVARDARRVLEGTTDARGRSLEVVPVPAPAVAPMTAEEAAGVDRSPDAKPRTAGDPVAASYVNCYVGDGVVVAPLVDPGHDEAAGAVLAAQFPGRRVVGVPAREILLGGGGIHCITQQVPAVAR